MSRIGDGARKTMVRTSSDVTLGRTPNAVGKKDIPVLQTAVLMVGIIYMVSTLLADLLIAMLNPRVRLERAT